MRSRQYFYLLLIALSVGVRLWSIAKPGFSGDILLNRDWGRQVLEVGLVNSYSLQQPSVMLPNYPPLGLLMFSFSADLERIIGPSLNIPVEIYYKIPALFFDLLTAMLIVRWLVLVGENRQARVAGAVFFWLPVVWFNSSYWGQTDSIFCFFGLLALYLELRKKHILGSLALVLAFGFKTQSVLFVPAYLYIAVYNFLHTEKRWRMLAQLFIGGLVGLVVVSGPFLLVGKTSTLLSVIRNSVGYYPVLSMNAYNLWWAGYADKARTISSSEGIGGLSWRLIGIIMWLIWIIAGIIPGLNENSRTAKNASLSIWRIFLMTLVGFFLWNTEMHERYLFALFPVSILWLFVNKMKGWVVWLSIVILYWFNLVGVLPFLPVDKSLFAYFTSFDVMIAHGLSLCLIIYSWILIYNPET